MQKRLEVQTNKVDSSRLRKAIANFNLFLIYPFFSHTLMVNHINWELRLILQEEFKNIFSMKNLVTNEDFKACSTLILTSLDLENHSIQGIHITMGNAGVKEKSNILGGRGPVVETIAQLQTHQAMSSQPKSSVDTTNYLSKKQKDLLKRAWVALHNNLSSVGMTTFIKIRRKKKTQPNYSLDSRLDPWHSEKLREHAHRIMKTVSDVISLLNKDEEKIEEMLVALGGKHHGFGVHIEILELMGPHFISAIYPTLKETWTEELQEAWQCLFNYIIALLHIGFDQALLAKVKPTWINYFD
ncbi:unnamed protein product [Lepeophtheirus salmonis]|uniref:(salmon louse) hypothetical protein n=1 Tax=Lepeophtheirus salmonis TaxID=72036 RepID=A0A7R8CEX8_LEPSM|nr:unnamed protein product [Lepeophtheirus salmonis]CAF2756282.1 unnamed protein product [Lepeophtheirus salmonis]